MNGYIWYTQLVKPVWAPPSWVFGPVWTVLYVIIAVSFGTVFYKAATRQIPWIVAVPFALNLVCNFAFTPIQFGLRNNILAAADIVLVIGTLAWAFVTIWNGFPELRWVVYVNIPYLVWGLFATALQFTVTYLNRG